MDKEQDKAFGQFRDQPEPSFATDRDDARVTWWQRLLAIIFVTITVFSVVFTLLHNVSSFTPSGIPYNPVFETVEEVEKNGQSRFFK